MKKLIVTILTMGILGALTGCQNVTPAVDPATIKAEQDALYEETAAPQEDSYVVIDEESYTERVQIEVPSAEDEQAVKEAAYQLFQIANRNDQNCLRRLAYTQNLVTTAGIEARNLVIDLKNGDEYLKYDLQPAIRATVLKISVDGHGKVTYARLGLDKAYYVAVDDSVINADWTGYADFGDTQGTLTTDTDRLYFHASQKPLYSVTEAVVNLDTITHATLTHNDAEGYYTIRFQLDPTAASKVLLPNLRKNSGINNAKYVSITETIEIWDNGFFKHFLSEDEWSGTKVVPIKSTIHFDTEYSYSAADCNLSAYCNGYYNTIRAAAEAANAANAAEEAE